MRRPLRPVPAPRSLALVRVLALVSPLFAGGCYHVQSWTAREALAELRESSTSGGGAGRGGDAAGPLDVEEAVALALRDNPEMRALRYERGIAEGQIVAARALANPTIDLQLLHVQSIGTLPASWALEAGWEPPQPEIFMARGAAARANLAAVKADVGERELALGMAVRSAHASLLAIDEQRAVLEQAIEVRRRVRELVEKRVAGGASTRLELGLAELALTTVERERDEFAARRISAGQQLADLLGVTHAPAVRGSIPDEPAAPSDLSTLEEQAIAARPALAAADARVAQREQQLRLEHGKRWPWFRFSAAPRYRSNDTTINPNDFSVGVQFVLPILDRNDGPIQVAEWAREQERERLRKQVMEVRRELASALDEIKLRRGALARFREVVLPAVERQEKLLASSASGGQLDLIAILSAEDAILRSRREYVEARLAYHKAWLSLARALGARSAPAGSGTDGAAPPTASAPTAP